MHRQRNQQGLETEPAGIRRPIIVSVSRRTDIPALYSEWFERRLAAGWAAYRHPYSGKAIQVSLKPDDVAGFVFWSKNFAPFLRLIPWLQDRYRMYFHFTITGYGPEYESGIPDLATLLVTFRQLSETVGPDHVILRYDPIIVSPRLPSAIHYRRFREIITGLENRAELCIISFVHRYAKIRPLLATIGADEEPDIDMKMELAATLKKIAADHGFRLESCCCPELQLVGVGQTSCISAGLFRRLYPDFPAIGQHGTTRKGCCCDRCQDIGVYDTCTHGCIYCYANANAVKVQQNARWHNPTADSLFPIKR